MSAVFDHWPGQDPPAYAAIAVSCKVLLVTLIWTFNNLEPDYPLDEQSELLRPWCMGTNRNLPHAAKYLRDETKGLGWCLAALRRICKRNNYYTTLYVLQTVPLRDDLTQGSCSKEACIAHNIDVEDYVQRHTTPDCDCQYVSVPVDDVIRIIDSGQIPVISTTLNDNNTLKVESVMWLERPMWHIHSEDFFGNRGPFRYYAAVSHVWADGLGNPNANALPKCQFRHIVTRLK